MSFMHLIYRERQMKWYIEEDNFKSTRWVISSGGCRKIMNLYL